MLHGMASSGAASRASLACLLLANALGAASPDASPADCAAVTTRRQCATRATGGFGDGNWVATPSSDDPAGTPAELSFPGLWLPPPLEIHREFASASLAQIGARCQNAPGTASVDEPPPPTAAACQSYLDLVSDFSWRWKPRCRECELAPVANLTTVRMCARLRTLGVRNLIFVGDSVTHGWFKSSVAALGGALIEDPTSHDKTSKELLIGAGACAGDVALVYARDNRFSGITWVSTGLCAKLAAVGVLNASVCAEAEDTCFDHGCISSRYTDDGADAETQVQRHGPLPKGTNGYLRIDWLRRETGLIARGNALVAHMSAHLHGTVHNERMMSVITRRLTRLIGNAAQMGATLLWKNGYSPTYECARQVATRGFGPTTQSERDALWTTLRPEETVAKPWYNNWRNTYLLNGITGAAVHSAMGDDKAVAILDIANMTTSRTDLHDPANGAATDCLHFRGRNSNAMHMWWQAMLLDYLEALQEPLH